ncbi:HlyD family type I secretion periplasmic adaptor subunit [Aurantimonas marina]|uniref:HlyD family type I secretion periplasmic adaptor subunit n=1 Tax=Aurantimonas marina TaxID=2780508 RepID=UPI0019D02C6E|nr:HlyD family type I secretion periplasmic adaptor subunit [Aurantimonas marina]
MTKNDDGWARDVKTGIRLITMTGAALSASFLLGFGAWAALAPLASAAVAPGVVAAAGQNQGVQHLEGGIVRTILVREGERIKAGQALFALDPTGPEAQRNRLQKQMVGLKARTERLTSERDGLEELSFPPVLHELAATEGIGNLLNEQEREFTARLDRHRQEQVIMGQRVQALREQIEGMSAQQTALERQLEVVREEVTRKRTLLDKGLTNRSEYTALLRSEADLVGQVGQSVSSILAAKTQIAEAQAQLARLDTQRVETAVTQLNEIRAQVSDTEEQLRAAEDVLDRIVVRSPSDGIIIKMSVNASGSVVRPGDQLLELLPTGEDLLIEARVSPQDVDVISIGQRARLRFSALNTRTTPTVEAKVTYLSADRLIDQTTQQPYYTARLSMIDDLPPEISRDQIYPGMPVEAYIATGERTFLEYLAKPITDSFSRAFRED